MLTNDHKILSCGKKHSLSGTINLILVFINIIIIRSAFVTDEKSYRLLAITLPLFLASLIYHFQRKDIIRQKQLAGNGPAQE